MNISYVAKITGLTSKTIRFYEQKGLLTPPVRKENGYRSYSQKNLDELMLLSQMRSMGFTLEECGKFIGLYNSRDFCTADLVLQALQKMHDIEKQMQALKKVYSNLNEVVDLFSLNGGATINTSDYFMSILQGRSNLNN
ncbi:MerR family transcriptional regulator [Citrobacter portucalensis]|uniref:MerR family transcriptional regulator n=1 Tax=Citrobacter portucalensis TaxID=1639133 RepID=UPI003CEFAB6B